MAFDTSKYRDFSDLAAIYSVYAQCVEGIEPQISVDFIDFENLPRDSTLSPTASPTDNDNSSDGDLDSVLPDPDQNGNNEGCQSSKKLPTWKVIVPPFVVVGVVLLI